MNICRKREAGAKFSSYTYEDKIKNKQFFYKINLGQHTFVPVLIHTFGDSESLR